jgi:thiamine pyrophosphate-dependent acetolactate synthase large subunit-like protein
LYVVLDGVLLRQIAVRPSRNQPQTMQRQQMTKTTGNDVLARALKRQGVDTFFFLMGGPMTGAEGSMIDAGLRGIDVRHEQAAAMMAHAYARVRNMPAVCVAASGPGTTNLVTGVANAYVDGAPVVAIGGSSSIRLEGLGTFQELDQVALMKPITRWAARVHDVRRIPELVDTAFRQAFGGRPGPVYLDMPADVIRSEVEEDEVAWNRSAFPYPSRQRTPGDVDEVARALDLISNSARPIVVFGSGVLWSGAATQLRAFVERAGIPFFATPQARGAIPEDHELAVIEARSTAFSEADLVILCGTRLNYVIAHGRPPRFSANSKWIQIDIESSELGRSRPVDVGIVGDVGAVLDQFRDADVGQLDAAGRAPWLAHLRDVARDKRVPLVAAMNSDAVPIHPARLCKEVSDALPRDGYLCVDGAQILDWGRTTIPSFFPAHRLNSGTFGTMGVGLPYALGAKVAAPDSDVIVLHGDGSFGLNAMELDTALRHGINVTCVISNNGGWTAADNFDTDGVTPIGNKAGRDLGYTRYDLMFQPVGCHTEYVDQPAEIAPAIKRAVESQRPSVVNVITDATLKVGGGGRRRTSSR